MKKIKLPIIYPLDTWIPPGLRRPFLPVEANHIFIPEPLILFHQIDDKERKQKYDQIRSLIEKGWFTVPDWKTDPADCGGSNSSIHHPDRGCACHTYRNVPGKRSPHPGGGDRPGRDDRHRSCPDHPGQAGYFASQLLCSPNGSPLVNRPTRWEVAWPYLTNSELDLDTAHFE